MSSVYLVCTEQTDYDDQYDNRTENYQVEKCFSSKEKAEEACKLMEYYSILNEPNTYFVQEGWPKLNEEDINLLKNLKFFTFSFDDDYIEEVSTKEYLSRDKEKNEKILQENLEEVELIYNLIKRNPEITFLNIVKEIEVE